MLFPGLLAIATIPLIAVAGIVQMAMMTGGYGDKDVRRSCFPGSGGTLCLVCHTLNERFVCSVEEAMFKRCD